MVEQQRSLQRQVDQLEGKIDRVDQKIVATSGEIRSTLDALTRVLEERWHSMEQRFDMSGRQQQQSIDLLVSTVSRIEQGLASTDTNVSMNTSEMKLIQERYTVTRGEVDRIGENLKWILRSLVLAALTIGSSIAVFFITHPTK